KSVEITEDTIQVNSLSFGTNTEEKLRDFKNPIIFPPGKVNALDNFFATLKKLSSEDELIRIVHYGDSQLEGDRISDYLRDRFQKRFGGCGVGLVPIIPVNDISGTFKQTASENWVRYASFGAERKQPQHKNYGLLGHYFSLYDHEHKPSAPFSGWAEFSRYRKTYRRFNVVEETKIIYRNKRSPITLKYKLNNNDGQVELPPNQDLGIKTIKMNGDFVKAYMEFKSGGSPDIYGVAFDCQRGIALDNVPMRGSSGTEFTQISKNFFREQVEKLNVKFMIVQYGVNVIPNIRDDYNYYEYSLSKQLKYLKSLDPELDILVVGVSDMSWKNGTVYESYPNVELVREAQKKAAFKAGCAFWDLYSAMGGNNSMISWVNAEPPLASKDYTHFTTRGARLVGEMLYNEIMQEYESYKKRMRSIQ
nr:hypothetical protein [Flammeovirgaceae bacterium]